MADEIFAAQDFIRTTLAADSALRTAFLPFIPAVDQAAFVLATRIHIGSAPQGAAFPLIFIRSMPSETDARTATESGRIFARLRLLIVAVTDIRSYKSINPIVDRMDDILEGSRGSGAGASILNLRRESPTQGGLQDVFGGVTHTVSGGFYRGPVQST